MTGVGGKASLSEDKNGTALVDPISLLEDWLLYKSRDLNKSQIGAAYAPGQSMIPFGFHSNTLVY